uniref:Uncharacterized protein n=1 Tax=Vespula pensylvanica TaxID=30213 RepID=A0A834NF50_VESPE|nr:hypothetical protein H0235_014698 [Vespula pensylvanica]
MKKIPAPPPTVFPSRTPDLETFYTDSDPLSDQPFDNLPEPNQLHPLSTVAVGPIGKEFSFSCLLVPSVDFGKTETS